MAVRPHWNCRRRARAGADERFAPLGVVTQFMLGRQEHRRARARHFRKWKRSVERKLLQRGANIGGQADRVNERQRITRPTGGRRQWPGVCRSSAGHVRRDLRERDDDGAAGAEHRERLPLDEIGGFLCGERVGE